MKAIGISSSGRKNAYSKIIVKDILEESGLEYETFNLAELNIRGCLGCLKCASNNRCVQKDDFQGVVDKIIEADALVFGGGNYYGMLKCYWACILGKNILIKTPRSVSICREIGDCSWVGSQSREERSYCLHSENDAKQQNGSHCNIY